MRFSLHPKFWQLMRISTIFLLVISLSVAASGAAQNVTIKVKDEHLVNVFKALEKQAGYRFFYNESLLATAKPVTIDVSNTPFEKVLQLCFINQPLTYAIVQKTVVIKEKT